MDMIEKDEFPTAASVETLIDYGQRLPEFVRDDIEGHQVVKIHARKEHVGNFHYLTTDSLRYLFGQKASR